MSISLALVMATAAPFADLDTIDREVARFTGATGGQPGGAAKPLDRRLRLRPCGSPLELAWHNARRETVVVQCPDAGGWRLFVPLAGHGAGAGAPPAINRGDAVTIAVTGEGFAVSQPGEAMETGAPGGWIRVRALRNAAQPYGDPMRAQVVRPGLVAIPLP